MYVDNIDNAIKIEVTYPQDRSDEYSWWMESHIFHLFKDSGVKYDKLSLGQYPTEDDIRYFRELNGFKHINT